MLSNLIVLAVKSGRLHRWLFVRRGARRMIALSSVDRLSLVEATAMDVQTLVSITVVRIFKAIEGSFNGEIDPLDLLIQDGVLTKFHGKPNPRILEIGTRTGETTAVILESFVSTYREPMFSSCAFEDTSPGLFVINIEFFRLDISQDPADQRFQVESYDFITAANASSPALLKHFKAKSIVGSSSYAEYRENMSNIRKLLQANGKSI
ncbi:hypothetical protein SBOR_5323 [Sclerotinia borealis F-4128]|uniref:Uncharacterized protein n=1 Tax=Sclerotinia borealis (strain F-4128) TaxID=1432307 RepID=W9CC63_SCLBF|nr:hypothetical protein SBOR_5323 [Sclerotinia borealis F-4128]